MLNSFPIRISALALALAMSGSAWALKPSDGAPDLKIFIPGSQAHDPVFGFLVGGQTVANAICADNATTTGTGTTTHIYFQGATPVNDSYSAVYCLASPTKIKALLGNSANLTTAGTYSGPAAAGDANAKVKVWISRRRLGASFVGLEAVTQNIPHEYLDYSSSGWNSTSGSYSSGGTSFEYNYSWPSTPSNSIAATAATSDVSPDVYWAEDNVTPGSTPIDASSFHVEQIAGHIIGIPVTLKLYRALQFAGIQSGTLPSTCPLPAGLDTVADGQACQPSLSRQQLVSLFSGTVADWTAVKVKVLASPPYPLTNTALYGTTTDLVTLASNANGLAPGVKAPHDNAIHICRRENGAGQQVAVLANILQYPCLGDNSPKIADVGGNVDALYATSLGAVDNCLKDLNDGTNGYFSAGNPNPTYFATGTTVRHNPAPYNDYRDIPQNVAHGDQWGLSIQTTERNASRGTNYRFIKIDGASSTGEQVYLGHYPLVGEYAITWSESLGADYKTLISAIAAAGKQPDTVKNRNSGLSNHTFGQAGYIALSMNGFTPTSAWDSTKPVTPYQRAVAGAGNACAVPTVNDNYSTFELR